MYLVLYVPCLGIIDRLTWAYVDILHHIIYRGLIGRLILYVIFLDVTPRFLTAIRRLKSCLTNIIEPDFSLFAHLLSLEVLTLPELADAYNERTMYGRSSAILKLLTSEDQCSKFLTALQRTGQEHVMNFITQNGGHISYHLLVIG